MYEVTCSKCKGTGKIPMFRHHDAGVCYDCMGKGVIIRKTKPKDLKWFEIWAVWKETNEFRFARRVEAASEKTALTKAKKILCFDETIFSWDKETIQIKESVM